MELVPSMHEVDLTSMSSIVAACLSTNAAVQKREWWQPMTDPEVTEPDDGRKVIEVDEAVASQRTELPDSFDHALMTAVEATKDAIEAGHTRLRIDFDTTLGDITYTTLKNSMPLVRITITIIRFHAKTS